MSEKFSARNSGAGNGYANFMGAWHFLVLSAGKPHAHKILRFRGGEGGCQGFLEGGGKRQFYFYGRGFFFSNKGHCTANASAPYRRQNLQKWEKRASGSNNSRFPVPQKRALRVKKSPFLYRAPQGKWGFVDSKRPFSGALGNRSLLTPKPSFPIFGDSDACRGRTRLRVLHEIGSQIAR